MPGWSAPKDGAVRRNEPVFASGELVDDGELRGPELPGTQWSDVTRDWWDMWRRSPQAQRFRDTDWFFMLETARLVEIYWNPPEDATVSMVKSVGTEIRLRLQGYGNTDLDRQRMRMNIKPKSPVAVVPDEGAAEPASMADYRKRLGQA